MVARKTISSVFPQCYRLAARSICALDTVSCLTLFTVVGFLCILVGMDIHQYAHVCIIAYTYLCYVIALSHTHLQTHTHIYSIHIVILDIAYEYTFMQW